MRLSFKHEIEKSRKERKPAKDIQELDHDAWFEQRLIDEEISILTTERLIRRAQRYFVPIPSVKEDGMWTKCEFTENRYILTSSGISKVRSLLRSEYKEGLEFILKILAALTGIVGAITGLVAVLLK
ncbi:MAG: hypothetical protein HZB87_04550 [Desulfatitalea sp.]|nr:hypothetical protein [Desulfatitalea sp.]